MQPKTVEFGIRSAPGALSSKWLADALAGLPKGLEVSRTTRRICVPQEKSIKQKALRTTALTSFALVVVLAAA
jgi:hypothetical protein